MEFGHSFNLSDQRNTYVDGKGQVIVLHTKGNSKKGKKFLSQGGYDKVRLVKIKRKPPSFKEKLVAFIGSYAKLENEYETVERTDGSKKVIDLKTAGEAEPTKDWKPYNGDYCVKCKSKNVKKIEVFSLR